jgi:hypothetical protein
MIDISAHCGGPRTKLVHGTMRGLRSIGSSRIQHSTRHLSTRKVWAEVGLTSKCEAQTTARSPAAFVAGVDCLVAHCSYDGPPISEVSSGTAPLCELDRGVGVAAEEYGKAEIKDPHDGVSVLLFQSPVLFRFLSSWERTYPSVSIEDICASNWTSHACDDHRVRSPTQNHSTA